MALLDLYRGTGADLPWGDQLRAHPGVRMEGYFWRFTAPPIASIVDASHTTHTTILASTFPNWYFMLHCFPQNKERLVLCSGKFSTPQARGKSSA